MTEYIYLPNNSIKNLKLMGSIDKLVQYKINPWKSIACNHCIDGQMIFDKGPKTIQWKDENLLINDSGKVYIHMLKKWSWMLLAYRKVNSKKYQCLTVKAETIKHLEENIREKLHNTEFGKFF